MSWQMYDARCPLVFLVKVTLDNWEANRISQTFFYTSLFMNVQDDYYEKKYTSVEAISI
jgi:hypothetical protein